MAEQTLPTGKTFTLSTTLGIFIEPEICIYENPGLFASFYCNRKLMLSKSLDNCL